MVARQIKGRYVDVHVHMGRKRDDSQRFTFQTLREYMDHYDVAQAVVQSGFRALREGDEMDDAQVAEEFAAHRGHLYPFAYIHPNNDLSDTELVAVLRRYVDMGAIGFGEHKPGENLTIDDPRCIRLYRAAAKLGLPVLFHMDSDHCIDEPGLPRLRRALQDVADCTFIAHGPGWWASISGDLAVEQMTSYPKGQVAPNGAVDELLAGYPNLYADLSAGSGLNAIRRDPEFGMAFLLRHADRLLFGTDNTGLQPRFGHFDYYPTLALPEAITAKILRENTRKLLGI